MQDLILLEKAVGGRRGNGILGKEVLLLLGYCFAEAVAFDEVGDGGLLILTLLPQHLIIRQIITLHIEVPPRRIILFSPLTHIYSPARVELYLRLFASRKAARGEARLLPPGVRDLTRSFELLGQEGRGNARV